MIRCNFCKTENVEGERLCTACCSWLVEVTHGTAGAGPSYQHREGSGWLQSGASEESGAASFKNLKSVAGRFVQSIKDSTARLVPTVSTPQPRPPKYPDAAQGSAGQQDRSETSLVQLSDRERLCVAAVEAFSNVSSDAKARFFTWLLPVARFDRVIHGKVLFTIYLLFAIAKLPEQTRQQLTLSLFRSEGLSEPEGKFEVGGEFQRCWLLLEAIELAGADASERAEHYIARLAREEGYSDRGIAAQLKKVAQYAHPLVERATDQLSNHSNPIVAIPGSFVAAATQVIREGTQTQTSAKKIDLRGLRDLIFDDLLRHHYVKELSKQGSYDAILISIRKRQFEFVECDSTAFGTEQALPGRGGRDGFKDAHIALQTVLQSQFAQGISAQSEANR